MATEGEAPRLLTADELARVEAVAKLGGNVRSVITNLFSHIAAQEARIAAQEARIAALDRTIGRMVPSWEDESGR